MKTTVLVAPTVEPITLAEAKEQLRIEDSFTLDDDYINSLISAARDRCEAYCNQFFTEKTISISTVDAFGLELYLPYPGLTVTAVSYVDSDGASQVIDPSEYSYNGVSQVLTFANEVSFKSLSVTATTSAPVELNGVKSAIKMIVTDLYELRTETAVGVSLADNPAVKAMLYPYRLELGV